MAALLQLLPQEHHDETDGVKAGTARINVFEARSTESFRRLDNCSDVLAENWLSYFEEAFKFLRQ